MASLKVIVFLLLGVTLELGTGKKLKFGWSSLYVGKEGMTCNYDGTSENREVLEIALTSLTGEKEQRLAWFKKDASKASTIQYLIEAYGSIDGMKATLNMTSMANAYILAYGCRIRWKNEQVSGEFTYYKGNRNNRMLKMMEHSYIKRFEEHRGKVVEFLNNKRVEMEEKCEKNIAALESISQQLDSALYYHPLDSCDEYRYMKADSPRVALTTKYGLNVLCDTTSSGGGWTVFQRRINGDVDFYRNWQEYENGFGSMNSSFWLGLKHLSAMTSQGQWELRIDFEFDNTAYFAEYSNFTVGDASTNYTLFVSRYNRSSNARDSFSRVHTKKMFSTYDRENDLNSKYNCAERYRSGWWFASCHDVNLNGIWGSKDQSAGLIWKRVTGNEDTATFSEMKIRKVQTMDLLA